MTCSSECRNGPKSESSVEATRQRRGRGHALTGGLVVYELREIWRWGQDKGLCCVWVGHWRLEIAGKISAKKKNNAKVYKEFLFFSFGDLLLAPSSTRHGTHFMWTSGTKAAVRTDMSVSDMLLLQLLCTRQLLKLNSQAKVSRTTGAFRSLLHASSACMCDFWTSPFTPDSTN